MLTRIQAKQAEGISLPANEPMCPSGIWNAARPSCDSNHNIAVRSITVGTYKCRRGEM